MVLSYKGVMQKRCSINRTSFLHDFQANVPYLLKYFTPARGSPLNDSIFYKDATPAGGCILGMWLRRRSANGEGIQLPWLAKSRCRSATICFPLKQKKRHTRKTHVPVLKIKFNLTSRKYYCSSCCTGYINTSEFLDRTNQALLDLISYSIKNQCFLFWHGIRDCRCKICVLQHNVCIVVCPEFDVLCFIVTYQGIHLRFFTLFFGSFHYGKPLVCTK